MPNLLLRLDFEVFKKVNLNQAKCHIDRLNSRDGLTGHSRAWRFPTVDELESGSFQKARNIDHGVYWTDILCDGHPNLTYAVSKDGHNNAHSRNVVPITHLHDLIAVRFI